MSYFSKQKFSKRRSRGNMPQRLALMAAAATVCAASAHGQYRASIQGTVTDTTGAVIPNATVTLTDIDTGKVVSVTSNASGTYSFLALAPDHFRINAAAKGFQQQVIDGVTIIPDAANAVNLRLEVGGSNTSVTVSADSVAPLDTATANIVGVVSSNEIQHLPSSGRDVFQLVQLAPGVFSDGAQTTSGTADSPGKQGPGGSSHAGGIFSTENGVQANANGGQYETNSISIDGISTVSAVWGGTSTITPNEDTVGELKVISNGYDAENGRFSGAQIQVTSKSGTNQFHGSAFFRANRPGLNAYQRYNGAGTFNSGTPDQRGLLRDQTFSNQLGGSFGGPIIKDKLFAFFGYETQRNNANSTSTGWYETAAYRAMAPANSIASKFLNFAGAAPSTIAQTDISCASVGLVEGQTCHFIAGQGLNLGSPITTGLGTQDLGWVNNSNPGVGGGLTNVATIANYTLLNPTTSVGTQYNGRLDADVTKKDHLSFAIYWVPLTNTSYNGTVRAYNLYHHSQINDAYTVIYNHIFSPTLLNEARAQDSGWRWNEITTNPQEPFGLPQDTVDTLGNINVAFFGAPGPSNFDQHTYSYKDVATKILNNHTIKFGGEVTRLYYLNNPTYSARPAYNFYNMWDFLNDAPHAESGSFNPTTGIPITNRQDNRSDLYGFFVQDDWKARPNLTLNAGLRYSYFGPLSAKANNLGVVQLGSGSAAYTGLSVREGGNLTNAQKGNFGPQFGFAFSPTSLHSRVVVRGGFGLNFNQTEIAISGNAGGNPPYVLNASYGSANPTAINPKIVYQVPTNSYTLFGYPANPNATGGFNSANLPVGGGAFITAFQNNQPTIYTEHYSLQTEGDMGHGIVATVGFQGSVSHHLIVQSFLYAATPLSYAENPLVSNIDYYGNTGHSNNNQLLLGLKKNMSHGFLFDAEYQYAKTMDTGSGPYYQDPYPFRPDLAYGRSDFNFGQAFKMYALWQPTFFHGRGFAGKVIDGFSFSGIYNLHTGFPYTPQFSTQSLYYANSPYSSLRPASYNGRANNIRDNKAFENGRPNVNFSQISSSALGVYNPYFGIPYTGTPAYPGAAYTTPSLPGVARNSFTGPGYQDVDLTVSKKFGIPNYRFIGEGAGLEIRADAFNVLNITNLNPGSIITNIQSANFGQTGPTGAGLGARVINLQARFSF